MKVSRNSKVHIAMSVVVLMMFCAATTEAANVPFVKGETIDYDITKFKIKVGSAKLVYNGPVQKGNKRVLWVTFTATGFKFFDEEQIYLDPTTFHPLLIKRNLNIFGNEEKIIEFYDAKKGEVRIIKTAKGKTTRQTIGNGSRFDNIYGFIYRQRLNGQFKIGEKLRLHLPTSDVQLELVKIKKIKAADQKFDAYYMRSTPRKYKVFFDNSPKRIPLRIEGALGIANMAMVMSERRQEG